MTKEIQPNPSAILSSARLWIVAVLVLGMIVAAFILWSRKTTAANIDASRPTVELAIDLPMTGDSEVGRLSAEGAQLAIEEANARRAGPRLELRIYDDKGGDDESRSVAARIVQSRAVAVIGPRFSSSSLADGPIYGQAQLVSLPPTATSDAVTQNPTTFRVVFKNSDQGEVLANFLFRVLQRREANLIVVDNAYGQTLRDGFRQTARRLGISVREFVYTKLDDADEIVRKIAADRSHAPVILAILDNDAVAWLTRLRRAGIDGPFLGGDSIGEGSFTAELAKLPEEHDEPGWFTRNLYGLAPATLDSANAETLAFVARFRKRFGHDPIWAALSGYDAARAAAEGIRRIVGSHRTPPPVPELRKALVAFMASLNAPSRALPGLMGPFWFDAGHGRPVAIRINRFDRGRLESAPLQFVPVENPSPGQIASGEAFEVDPGKYARLQRVVYSGIFVNEISHLDLQHSVFDADFYLWLRYAKDGGADSADPTDIAFPNMLKGSFDKATPAKAETIDGIEYRLWRVQGQFQNDFDLRAFPFDEQNLRILFFNARADMDRIVYALDTTINPDSADIPPAAPEASDHSVTAEAAFRNLTQWEPVRSAERRENLVTESSLGDPSFLQSNGHRELSGFAAELEVKRRTASTLAKNLIPLILMTLIMFGSLYFPHHMAGQKVSVATTAALSAAVLLTAINAQLGEIGYTIRIEYVFYAFFGLCVLCIASVLGAERLRMLHWHAAAVRIEYAARTLFVLTVAYFVLSALFVQGGADTATLG